MSWTRCSPASSLVPTLALALLILAPVAGAATALGGRVSDDDGRPLEGAEVALRPVVSSFQEALSDLDGVFLAQPVERTVSDEDGRFLLRPPDDGFWDVTVSAAGRLPVESRVGPLLDAGEMGPLTPPQDAGLAVRVVDEKGQPVAGATVAVEREGLSASGLAARRWRSRAESLTRRRAVTDETGGAVLPRRDDEILSVRAVAPGLAPAVVTGVETAEVELTMTAGRPVTVEVLGADGRPAAGAVLLADGVPWDRTDTAGRRMVQAPDDRSLVVSALAPDEQRGHVVLTPPEEGEEEVEGRGSEPAPPTVLRLATPVTVAGRTLDTEREPVAGAWVWEPARPHLAVRSDGRGNFSLPRPAPRSDEERGALAAAAEGYLEARETMRPEQVAGGETTTVLLLPAAAATGRVVDTDGVAVAGVVVTASPADPGFGRRLESGERRARSGGDGAFRLAGLAPDTPYRLSVRHRGYAPAEAEVAALEPGTTRHDVQIVLRPGITAFGVVVDVEGERVPGAAVVLAPQPETGGDMMALFRRLRDEQEVTAEADRAGVFEIPDLAPGRYHLAARAAGFAPLEVPGVELPRGEARVDLGSLVLEPGVSLRGTVVDGSGQPVEGARVQVSGARGMLSVLRPARPDDPPAAVTGADGAFRVDDLARDRQVRLSVRHDAYADRLMEGVRVPPDEPLEIVLQAASRLSGVVVDGAGEAIEDAHVFCRSLMPTRGGSGDFSRATTDASGRFTLEDVTPGEVTVSVSASGFVTEERGGVHVGVGETRDDLRFTLEPGATVEGRVVDASGRPLAEARVRVNAAERRAVWGPSASTDADGAYRLEGVPLGERSISAEHDEHLRQVRDLRVTLGDNRLDFRLPSGSSVAGRVTDAGGAPVAGARVMLGEVGRPAFSSSLTDATGEDGSYRVAGVAPGRYQVTATKEGFAAAELEEPIEVAAAPLQGVDLTLTTGATIVGRLLGADLQQLSAATVGAGSQGPSGARMPLMGSVDYEGKFQIQGVSPGDWMVFAAIGDGMRTARETVSVEPGDREVYVELDLSDGFTLAGTVTLGGEPMTGAAVALTASGQVRSGYASTNHQGRFEVSGLEAGEYELTVISLRAGGQVHEETVQIAGDREIRIDIATAELSGVVVDATTGAPLEGAEVRLEPVEETEWDWRVTTRRTDADGRFLIPSVPAGEHRVRADLAGYAPGDAVVRVDGSGGGAALELRLEPTRGLTLEVHTSFGAPPERVLVAALDPDAATGASGTAGAPGSELGGPAASQASGSPAAAPAAPRAVFNDQLTTGEGGRVRLDRLPAGRWRLLVGGTGLATTAVEVTAPGHVVPVTLAPEAALLVHVPDLDQGRGEVRLTGADGRPFVGLHWNGRPIVKWDLALGHCRIGGLPGGVYEVTVTTDAAATWTGRAQVPPAGTAEITLE